MAQASGPHRELARSQAPIVLYVALFVAIIGLFIGLPNFRTATNLSNLLLRSVPILAVSVGQTFVLLAAGIDLSVGAVLALSTTIASVTMSSSIGGGILLTLTIGMGVGLFNGLAVTRLRINPFLVTLSTTIIFRGIALFVRPYPGGVIPTEYVNFVMMRVGNVPVVPMIIFALIVVAGITILRKTLFGRHLYAVGGNAEAARLAGIKTELVTVGAYVFSGLFASIGGLYMTARICCGDPAVGAPFQMESITAAVIGGTALTGGRGGVAGTTLGVILMVMLGNIFNLLNIDIYWQQVIRGMILLSVVGFSQYSMSRRDKLKRKRPSRREG